MRISPITYTGKKEIANYAKIYAPLSEKEQKLKILAEKVADATPYGFDDKQIYLPIDKRNGDEFMFALQYFAYQPSSFAYKVAVDAIESGVSDEIAETDYLKTTAREIAKLAPEITKEDIYKDWNKLK